MQRDAHAKLFHERHKSSARPKVKHRARSEFTPSSVFVFSGISAAALLGGPVAVGEWFDKR